MGAWSGQVEIMFPVRYLPVLKETKDRALPLRLVWSRELNQFGGPSSYSEQTLQPTESAFYTRLKDCELI